MHYFVKRSIGYTKYLQNLCNCEFQNNLVVILQRYFAYLKGCYLRTTIKLIVRLPKPFVKNKTIVNNP